jgi:hypothetical protein
MRDIVRALVVAVAAALAVAQQQTAAPPVTGPAGTYTAAMKLEAPGPISVSTSGVPTTGPAGTYTIEAPGPVTIVQFVNDHGTSLIFSWGPKPPVPSPQPEPTPPASVQGHLWTIAVYEYDDLAKYPPPQLAMRVSTTMRPSMAEMDCTWRVYDDDNPAISSWRPALQGIPLPSYLVLAGEEADAKVVDKGPLPPDEPAMIAVVKKLRGLQ